MKAIEGPFNPTYDSLANYNVYFQTCFIFFYAGIQYAVETVSDKKVTVVHARWTKWVPNRHQRIGRNGRRSIKGWWLRMSWLTLIKGHGCWYAPCLVQVYISGIGV